MAEVSLSTPSEPTFYFIGVTTGHSSSRKIFPQWMGVLNRPEVKLVGIDMKIHADPDSYRQVVAHLKQEPLALGGLVTTHKIDLLEAARDMFDELGPFARLTNEVSSIAKDGESLVGRATDPIAGGLSMDAILGEDYFARTDGQVLLLGAGGSAVALSLHLIQKPGPGDRPSRIVVVNRSAGRLAKLQQMVSGLDTDIQFEFIQNNIQQRNDELLTALPPGSVIINATGMGKDTPGSPLTDSALFPQKGVIWELNYRGALDFLQQAKARQSDQQLTVVDGWGYFLHGWTQVMAHVLHVHIDSSRFAKLSQVAVALR